MGEETAVGLRIEDFESDEAQPFVLVDAEVVGKSTLTLEARKLLVEAKAEGVPTKIIAMQLDVSEATVDRIWRDFIKENTTALSDLEQTVYHRVIRRKSVRAIEAGLECTRDPYRQASVGIAVMKGIGEFRSEADAGSKTVNILVNAVPPDWKGRYIQGKQDTKE